MPDLNVRKENKVEHYPVAAADIIEIGDNVFYNSTSKAVESLTDFVWNTDLATTQGDLKGIYAGVALSRSRGAPDNDVDDIRVAVEGVAEFDCASASFEPDQFIGAAKASGNALEAKKVVAVADATLAIGKPVNVVASVTKLFVRFQSDIGGQPIA